MENTSVMNIDDLIAIEQMPVITEQLKAIKGGIESKTAGVLMLDCNENTVKAIKVLRADLSKDFKMLEERRKFVKNKINEPYEAFERIYKECVTDIFKSADTKLKKRIDEVEDKLKEEKRIEIEGYFDEYALSKGIDFVGFLDAQINVTMSASKKSLKASAKAFIDRICDDLKLIDTQEYKAEILVEYKNTLNVSNAITSVNARHEAIRYEQEKAERLKVEQQEIKEKTDKVIEIAKAEQIPLSSPTINDDDEIVIMKLPARVKAKKSDLRILKQLLTNGKYEIIK